MTLKAAFFDVGDTLVEHWAERDQLHALLREALRREFGERHWYDDWLGARLGPSEATISYTDVTNASLSEEERLHGLRLQQETLRWYEEWFRNSQIGIDDVDLERLRVTMTVPLDLVSKPVPGAFEAVRWCRSRGLRVVLVTNTLSRGDDEVWTDWRRFGLADSIDAVVSSHTVGWQKPHPKIFERALALAGARPDEAFMVGDRLDADVVGAKRLGMRAVWRRTEHPQATVDVEPDATIDDLTQLPAAVSEWIDVPSAQRTLSGRSEAGRP